MHTLSTEVKAVLDRFAPQCFQLHVSTYTFYFIIMHYIVINLSEGLIPIKCKKSSFKAKQVCGFSYLFNVVKGSCNYYQTFDNIFFSFYFL